MWRTPTSRKGRHILNAARKLATEAAPPKQNVAPVPQPPSKSRSSRALKFIGLSLPVVASGLVGYAWYDVDFRKQIEDNIPYAKELFENILPKDEETVPVTRRNIPDLSLQKASILNAQEDAAKHEKTNVSRKAASHFETYSTAQCSTEREESVKDGSHLKHDGNIHFKTIPDLYASYIQPSFGKANVYPQPCCAVQEEKDNDTNEEDDENGDDEEDEEEEESQQSKQRRENQRSHYSSFEDQEMKLVEEILANISNPFHNLAVPEMVQGQKYTIYGANAFGDLLIDVDTSDDRAPEKGLTTALQEKGDRAPEKGLTTALQEKASEKKSEQVIPSAVDTELQRKEDERADNAALEVVIHKLTTNSQKVIAEAVKAQADVSVRIRNQTTLLKHAMEDTSDLLMKDAQWEDVAVAHKERELAMKRANELLAESKTSVEKLRDILQAGRNNRVTQNNPAISSATKQLGNFIKELGTATVQVRQAETEANVMQKYKDLVDKGKKQFRQEIESLVPSLKLGSNKNLSDEELNALISHAHRRVQQLQKQVAEQLAMERQRLTSALEIQRQKDLNEANSALNEERNHLQKEFEAEKSKMDKTHFEQVEIEVRRQLTRQAAAHSDHLREALTVQQQSLSKEFNQSVQVKLLEERGMFQSEVAGWISRLKGIEAAVEARAMSEKLARCAQDLWLACIALNTAIYANSDTEEERPLQPLKSNVDLILETGNKHPFVESVARSFPHTAVARGVSTEDELRSRFHRVSNICRRLGLVDTSNSSMYKYLISYLHSFIVLDNVIATEEDEEIDLTNLDNFALLSHAQYWMEKGNMNIALRFMVQLTGESRRAASDWIEEARLLLETKQIANTLMAYASATGLANTF